MSKHSRARENTWHIDQAVREGKPFNAVGGIGGEIYILHLPAVVRDVSLPEPVTWRDLNGRPPAAWEEPLIVAARTRERRAELALLAGTLGQP